MTRLERARKLREILESADATADIQAAKIAAENVAAEAMTAIQTARENLTAMADEKIAVVEKRANASITASAREVEDKIAERMNAVEQNATDAISNALTAVGARIDGAYSEIEGVSTSISDRLEATKTATLEEISTKHEAQELKIENISAMLNEVDISLSDYKTSFDALRNKLAGSTLLRSLFN